MRPLSTYVFPFAAASLVAASRPASAQRASVASDRSPRAVAAYHLAAPRGVPMPRNVSVVDSAGTLAATFAYVGDRAARPMAVHVVETDVVLQAATPDGLLTLVLYGLNDPAAVGRVLGRWSLGALEGELRGRVRR